MIVIGADPGREGAVVLLSGSSSWARVVLPRYDKHGILDILRLRLELDPRPAARRAYMELPKGRGGWSATGNFRVGWMGGQLLAELRVWATGGVHLVRPAEWQAPWHAGQTGHAKDKTRAKYEQLFPHDPVGALPRARTEGTIDALMIAAWAVQTQLGLPLQPWELRCAKDF